MIFGAARNGKCRLCKMKFEQPQQLRLLGADVDVAEERGKAHVHVNEAV
jgi:hypothetical protein